MQHSIFSFSLILLFLHCTKTLAQSPAEAPAVPPAPARPRPRPRTPAPPSPLPSGPTDTIQVLLKAGHFTAFVRLIKATHVDAQLLSQLNSSSDGITIFAPTDTAFSNLKSGALGSLNDREKVELVQFHMLPRFLSVPDFQTLSNPVRTLAGSDQRFPMTITTTENSVNVNTGLTKTSLSGTVYTDKQIAIYQVDKVLLPKDVFPPTPAQAPAKPAETADNNVPKDASGAASLAVSYYVVLYGVVGMVTAMFSL